MSDPTLLQRCVHFLMFVNPNSNKHDIRNYLLTTTRDIDISMATINKTLYDAERSKEPIRYTHPSGNVEYVRIKKSDDRLPVWSVDYDVDHGLIKRSSATSTTVPNVTITSMMSTMAEVPEISDRELLQRCVDAIVACRSPLTFPQLRDRILTSFTPHNIDKFIKQIGKIMVSAHENKDIVTDVYGHCGVVQCSIPETTKMTTWKFVHVPMDCKLVTDSRAVITAIKSEEAAAIAAESKVESKLTSSVRVIGAPPSFTNYHTTVAASSGVTAISSVVHTLKKPTCRLLIIDITPFSPTPILSQCLAKLREHPDWKLWIYATKHCNYPEVVQLAENSKMTRDLNVHVRQESQDGIASKDWVCVNVCIDTSSLLSSTELIDSVYIMTRSTWGPAVAVSLTSNFKIPCRHFHDAREFGTHVSDD